MKYLRPVVLAVAWASMLPVSNPVAFAQAVSDPIKEYLGERDKLNQDLTAKLDVVAKTIESEVQAGRLKPDQAQLQRQRVSDLRPGLATLSNIETNLTQANVGAAAPALNKAWDDVKAALKTRETVRSEKLNQAKEAVVQQAVNAWQKAERAEDLNSPLEMVQQAERALSSAEARTTTRVSRPSFGSVPGFVEHGTSSPLDTGVFQEVSRLLSASQRFLAAFASKTPQMVTESYNQLAPHLSGQWARIVTPNETEQWRQRFVQKATDEVEALRAEADALVAKSAGSKEILAMADKLQPATDRLNMMKGQGMGPSGGNDRDFLRGWGRALERMESGDWASLQREIDSAGSPPVWLSAAGRKGFYARLRAADAEKAAAEKEARAKSEAEIRERLGKVTNAASASDLADNLPIKAQGENDGTRERLIALQSDLRRLAAAWTSYLGEGFSPEMLRESGTSHPWQADLRQLRGKIFREYLAQKTTSPELLEPPLNALSPEAAVRKLGLTLKEKQEWMRLHNLLSSLTLPGYGGRDWQYTEELRGLKAYLTGQNFERAEQYREAAQSYAMVMSCIGELVPVEAAAERLKVIAREHPETRPSSAARPAPSPVPASSSPSRANVAPAQVVE